MFLTPPKYDHDDDDEDDIQYRGTAETPAPHRARVNNLTNQVSELLRNKQHLEKGHKAEISGLKNEMDQTKKDMEKYKAEAKMKERELLRCKAEGDGMREEVSSMVEITNQQADIVAQSVLSRPAAESGARYCSRANADNRAGEEARSSRG